MNKDSKIYVAGHSGMVGSAIIRGLRTRGYENINYVTRKECDLTNQAEVRKYFETQRPDYVIDAAARVGGINANNKYRAEFLSENLIIQHNIIDSAHRYNVNKLLFLGSSCIYPRNCDIPINEKSLLTGQLEPTNEPYAIAKIAGIKMCENYYRQYGSNFISAMPTNLFGLNDNFDLDTSHVLPALIRKIVEAKIHNNNEVVVWGTGKPRREFLYIDDCADACIFLIENLDAEELYGWDISQINVGSGKDISISELATIIAKVIGYEKSIIFDSSMPDGVPRKVLDVSRINKLGWKSSTSLFEGISKTYEWYVKEKCI